jgi:hypothetical protein
MESASMTYDLDKERKIYAAYAERRAAEIANEQRVLAEERQAADAAYSRPEPPETDGVRETCGTCSASFSVVVSNPDLMPRAISAAQRWRTGHHCPSRVA